MKVKQARKYRDTLLIVGFALMLTAYMWDTMFYVGLVVTCSSLIPHFLYNRCPHCGKQLGRNEGKFCQFCGNSLDD